MDRTDRSRNRLGFSLVEFLVLIGVVALLISIFVPFLARGREMEHRARCARNLANINIVLRSYADRNNYLLPSVIHDTTHKPNGYTAFTGPDDPDPFAPGSKVAPNDVTASLFLLMRYGYISDGRQVGLSLFICPSSGDEADTLTDAGGGAVESMRRSNFRGPRNLSYGYCSPFSSSPKFQMNTDVLGATFAVMADKSPGVDFQSDVTGPAMDAPALEIAKANSRNHDRAGQNVLYGDGHVSFERTPYCGYRDAKTPLDNIYTAAASAPTTLPTGNAGAKGFFGRSYAPATWADSYIVPSEHDRD